MKEAEITGGLDSVIYKGKKKDLKVIVLGCRDLSLWMGLG